MEKVEELTRAGIKREKEYEIELDSMSDWIKAVEYLVQRRIQNLKNCSTDRPK